MMKSIPERSNPIELFREWFDDVQQSGTMEEPSVTTLATVDADGMPWTRMVLLKGIDERGFVFYTNLGSIKAQHLRENPRAGLGFYWMSLKRQVRVVGKVDQVSDSEADTYFASRDRESQIGAGASKQSKPLESQGTLLERVAHYAETFEDQDVPRPPFWSGYRLMPDLIEFWLNQPFRLHERIVYKKLEPLGWSRERLYP